MSALVTSKFDEDPIKNKYHFPIISLWEIFRRSRAPYCTGNDPICLKFEPIQDFIPVLITCKFEKDLIKNNREKMETPLASIKSQWELSVAMATTVLIGSAPKPYVAVPPPYRCDTWNLVKTGQLARCILVRKSLMWMDRFMDDEVFLYYKLTLQAFDKGKIAFFQKKVMSHFTIKFL